MRTQCPSTTLDHWWHTWYRGGDVWRICAHCGARELVQQYEPLAHRVKTKPKQEGRQ